MEITGALETWLYDTRSLQNIDISVLAGGLYCFEVYHCPGMGGVFDICNCVESIISFCFVDNT